ncbi:MAG TPA: serine protease [Polyangiaceae bacterium]|nr:serine protease [Polyangiaceae bacterium]
MISAGQQRAICRIWVAGTESRGTGFLIGDDAVLTAAHVVKKSNKEPNEPYPGKVKLHFGVHDGTRFAVTEATVDATQFDPKLDWAIVRLPKGTVVPAAKPFKGLPLPAENTLAWDTFGYSRAEKDVGKAYDGLVVAAGADLIQLRLASSNDRVAGLSGSPCLVDGFVVGIIVKSQDDTEPTDTLYVRPIEHVKCSALALLPRDAPYAEHVRGSISPFEVELRKVAVKLELTLSEEDAAKHFAPGRLAKRCAITMMGGVEPTVKVLLGINQRFRRHWQSAAAQLARETLQLAARAWIETDAVRLLAEQLEAGQNPIVLNTDKPRVAEDYLHRASCLADPVPGRFDLLVPIDAVAADDAELVAAFSAAVVAHPRIAEFGETAAEALENYPHAALPIVAWFSSVPPRTAFDAIRNAGAGYDQVRMLFLVGSGSPDKLASEYPEAVVITPPPRPDAVDEARKAFDRGMKTLLAVFPELKKKSSDGLQQAI